MRLKSMHFIMFRDFSRKSRANIKGVGAKKKALSPKLLANDMKNLTELLFQGEPIGACVKSKTFAKFGAPLFPHDTFALSKGGAHMCIFLVVLHGQSALVSG